MHPCVIFAFFFCTYIYMKVFNRVNKKKMLKKTDLLFIWIFISIFAF